MAIRKEKLENLKGLLTTRREVLAHELRQATAQLIADDSSYSDAIDQASADTDKAIALQMKNRDRDVLWQIDEALKRMDSGDYGTCERCEDEIGDARLKAFPLTTLCIDCKSELESEEHRIATRAAV